MPMGWLGHAPEGEKEGDDEKQSLEQKDTTERSVFGGRLVGHWLSSVKGKSTQE